MLTIVLMILTFAVLGKLLGFAFQVSWKLLKVVFGLVFLPLILVALILFGVVYLTFPILLIAGIIALISGAVKKAA